MMLGMCRCTFIYEAGHANMDKGTLLLKQVHHTLWGLLIKGNTLHPLGPYY